MSNTAYHNFTVRRDINETEREGETYRTRKVGEEDVLVELSVDLEKLARNFRWKITRGQKRAIMANGAIVAKVLKRTPTHKEN